MAFLSRNENLTQWVKTNFADLLPHLIKPLCLCASVFKYLVNYRFRMNHLMEHKLADFRETGGFSENLTKIRLEARQGRSVQAGAPKCPICGKPMLKRMCRRGKNAGKPFWSCSAYPDCQGTREFRE